MELTVPFILCILKDQFSFHVIVLTNMLTRSSMASSSHEGLLPFGFFFLASVFLQKWLQIFFLLFLLFLLFTFIWTWFFIIKYLHTVFSSTSSSGVYSMLLALSFVELTFSIIAESTTKEEENLSALWVELSLSAILHASLLFVANYLLVTSKSTSCYNSMNPYSSSICYLAYSRGQE